MVKSPNPAHSPHPSHPLTSKAGLNANAPLFLREFESYAHIQTPIFLLGCSDLSIQKMNGTAARTCGYRLAEVDQFFFPKLFRLDNQARLKASLEAGVELEFCSEFHLALIRKSGREIVVNLLGKKLYFHADAYLLITLFDITELSHSYEVLEDKVRARTQDLEHAKNRLQAIFNSARQGFFTLGRDLKIEADPSVRVTEWLGDQTVGRALTELLPFKPDVFESFARLVFEQIRWDMVKELALFEVTCQEQVFRLEFTPMVESQEVQRMLGTMTDITPLRRLEQKAETVAAQGRTLVRILQSTTSFAHFSQSLQGYLKRDAEFFNRQGALQALHTLKGEAAFFELGGVVELCQLWENRWNLPTLAEAFDPQEFSRCMRALWQQLHQQLAAFPEIWERVAQERRESEGCRHLSWHSLARELATLQREPAVYPVFLQSWERLLAEPLAVVCSDLGKSWLKLAQKLNKPVHPLVFGGETRLFPAPYHRLWSSLIHAVRNTLDHGIETATVRAACGKPHTARLVIELQKNELQNGVISYTLTLLDDGRGLNAAEIARRASQLGLALPQTEAEVLQLVFAPSFSTRLEADDLSGQGIGLKAVLAEAVALGGGARVANLQQTSGAGGGGGMRLTVWFQQVTLEDFLQHHV